MGILGIILFWILNLYFYVLIARLILDFARQANPTWRPKKLGMSLASIIYALTDAPLKLVHRVIKPFRVGGLMLDLGWTALLLVVMFLRDLAASI